MGTRDLYHGRMPERAGSPAADPRSPAAAGLAGPAARPVEDRLGLALRRIVDAPAFYALVAAVGLGIGLYLTPSASGMGTHEALGLPPCAFRYATGLPCPGCGLTTAVSHAAHGHFVQSFLTQPAGFLFGVALWVTVPLMLYAAWRRVPAAAVLPRAPRHAWGWGIVIFPVVLAAWAYKLLVVAVFS